MIGLKNCLSMIETQTYCVISQVFYMSLLVACHRLMFRIIVDFVLIMVVRPLSRLGQQIFERYSLKSYALVDSYPDRGWPLSDKMHIEKSANWLGGMSKSIP